MNVILRFDEGMLEKCSKKQHELLKREIYNGFLLKSEVEQFQNDIKTQQEGNEKRIQQVEEIIRN